MGRLVLQEPSKASCGTPLTGVAFHTRRFVCLQKTHLVEAFDFRQHPRTMFFLAKLCFGRLISRCPEESAGEDLTRCLTRSLPRPWRTEVIKRSRMRSVLWCPDEIEGRRCRVLHLNGWTASKVNGIVLIAPTCCRVGRPAMGYHVLRGSVQSCWQRSGPSDPGPARFASPPR